MEFLIIFFGLVGFSVSFYIFIRKRQQKSPHCFIKQEHCGEVLASKYAQTLGVHNEILGMVYYGLIIAVFSFFNPFSGYKIFEIIFTILTFVAAAFSLYLTGVQKFILKKWCEFCLASAASSIFIFLLFSLGF